MLAINPFARCVVAIGVGVVLADEVGGDGEVVVRVGLAVGHHVHRPGDSLVAGLEVAQQQFIEHRIVVGRFGPLAAVRRHVGRDDAQVVGLHSVVGRALLARPLGVDARQQAARPVARANEGIDWLDELVRACVLRLDAVQRFVVLGIRLAANRVRDAGLGHQIAFVRGVDEHLAAKGPAALHRDRDDSRAVLVHSVLEVQSLAFGHAHLGLGEHVAEDPFRRVRLKRPHGIFAGRLSGAAVLVARLIFPSFGPSVVLSDAAIELARDAADHRLVADVGRAEAAGREPADVPARLDEHDRLAHAPRLHRRGDAPGRAAVDDDVERIGLSRWRRRAKPRTK